MEALSKMRIGVPLSLYSKTENMPAKLNISYQASMLSLIKFGLSNTNPELFKYLYAENRIKDFAISVFFPHAQFQGKTIVLGEKQNAIIYFSTNDMKLGLNFFNAFQWLCSCKDRPFNSTLNVNVGRVFDVPVPTITSERVIFKTMSPLVIRRQDGYFLSCVGNRVTEEYRTALKESVRVHQTSKAMQGLVDTLEFTPLNMKKTVMNPFGQYVEASVGTFELKGSPLLLNDILNSGLGGKRGSFAGMLGLVKEVEDDD